MSHAPLTRGDREFQKFTHNSNDEVCVNTVTEITGGNLTVIPPVNMRVTTIDIGDTATVIPPSIDANTISFTVYNKSSIDTLYYNSVATVEASDNVGTDAGAEIGAGETHNFDLSAAAIIYAIAPTGKTIRVKITEWIK